MMLCTIFVRSLFPHTQTHPKAHTLSIILRAECQPSFFCSCWCCRYSIQFRVAWTKYFVFIFVIWSFSFSYELVERTMSVLFLRRVYVYVSVNMPTGTHARTHTHFKHMPTDRCNRLLYITNILVIQTTNEICHTYKWRERERERKTYIWILFWCACVHVMKCMTVIRCRERCSKQILIHL